MKITKRILAILLAMTIGLGLFVTAANAEESENSSPLTTYMSFIVITKFVIGLFYNNMPLYNEVGDRLGAYYVNSTPASIEDAYRINSELLEPCERVNGKKIADIIDEAALLCIDDWFNKGVIPGEALILHTYGLEQAAYYNRTFLPGKSYANLESEFFSLLKHGPSLDMYYHYWLMAANDLAKTETIDDKYDELLEAYYGAGSLEGLRDSYYYVNGFDTYTAPYISVSPISAFTPYIRIPPYNLLSAASSNATVSGAATVTACDLRMADGQQPSSTVTISLPLPADYAGNTDMLKAYINGTEVPFTLRALTGELQGQYMIDIESNALGTLVIADTTPITDSVTIDVGEIWVQYPYDTFGSEQPALSVVVTSARDTGVHDADTYRGLLPVSGYGWDISFGDGLQPAGEVTVRVPFPADKDISKLSVYHVDDNGTYTRMTILNLATAEQDGYLEFRTNHFSEYLLFESHDHDYINTVVPSTLEAQGYTEHVCKICQYSHKDTYTGKLTNEKNAPVIKGETKVPYLGSIKLTADQDVTWSGSNKNVKVHSDGTVESLKSFTKTGKITVTATSTADSTLKAEYVVKVKPSLIQWLQIIFLFGWIWM